MGFGDEVVPSPKDASFPALLDFPAPEIRMYARPTVVSEKLHSLVTLGIANTRMKDFYDLWYLSRTFGFEGSVLVDAIRSTFERRETELPAFRPQALSETFAEDEQKQQQWAAFLDRTRLESTNPDLAAVVDQLGVFLWPPLQASGEDPTYRKHWTPGGPWSE